MPAARSRTENWRRSLERIAERNGSLEISMRQPDGASAAAIQDLVWRVRIVTLTNDEIIVEPPQALGREIPFAVGVDLVGVMTVGQNRWMFRTQNLGVAPARRAGENTNLRLAIPTTVERCSRRNFFRVSTEGLTLPQVTMRPLLDQTTCTPAEIAVRERIESLRERGVAGAVGEAQEPIVMPEVGPALPATLLNLGGGGVGVLVMPEEAAGLDSGRRFWMTIDLTPRVPAPLGVMTRLAHTRIDSEQRLYAGMSFEFDHHPAYRTFVVNLLSEYVEQVQREQIAQRARAS